MSKKLAQEYLKKGDKINTKVIFDNGKKFELNVKGEIKAMSDSGFNKKQLEQIAQVVVTTIKPMLDPIIERLDNIESRLDVLESLPIIQKELKAQNKK